MSFSIFFEVSLKTRKKKKQTNNKCAKAIISIPINPEMTDNLSITLVKFLKDTFIPDNFEIDFYYIFVAILVVIILFGLLRCIFRKNIKIEISDDVQPNRNINIIATNQNTEELFKLVKALQENQNIQGKVLKEFILKNVKEVNIE